MCRRLDPGPDAGHDRSVRDHAGAAGDPRRARQSRLRLTPYGLALGLALSLGCTGKSGGTNDGKTRAVPTAPSATASCDTTPKAAEVSPGVPAKLRSAEPWIDGAGDDVDEVILTADQIEALNEAHAAVPDSWTDPRDEAVADAAGIEASLTERERWLADKLARGDYVEGTEGAFSGAIAIQSAAVAVDELRVVADTLPLWCVPTRAGLYTPARDLAFDRNRCTGLHAGELVRVLRRHPKGAWHYVHAGHSVGWLHAPAWTPALDEDEVDAFVDAERVGVVVRDDVLARPRGEPGTTADPVTLRLGHAFPLVTGPESAAGALLRVPTLTGLQLAAVPGDAVHAGHLPLTRRNFLQLAFSELDDPYGWGGYRGGRDCSRYVHDLLGAFGIRMARNSAVQAKLGTEQIELAGLSEEKKLAAIESAHARGLVLLYMQGHIMIYLGQRAGSPYALSSLSEFLEPCPTDPEGGDRVWRLDRVEVTTLELGRNTSRTAFIERLERAVVFAPPTK